MKMYNKHGKSCNCDIDQREVMEKAGWSVKLPKPAEADVKPADTKPAVKPATK